MCRTTWILLPALGLILCASSAQAINWNDIAVGTDAGINGGSVFTLKRDSLDNASPVATQNPAINQGAIADVGFQTAGTPQPPNTPPGTIGGGPTAPLETVVWLTTSGVITNANANRPADKVLNSEILPGFFGSDLTVLGDDTVFFGGSVPNNGQIRSSGLDMVNGTPATGDGVIDSVWQKIPSDNVAIAFISAGVGTLGVRDGDGTTVGADVALPAFPVDVDAYRQDPTLVVALADNTLSVRDGLSLAELNSTSVGAGDIVAISVLSDRSTAVALFDGTDSLIEIYDQDLNFVSDSGMLFDGVEITAMDNQNTIDTLVVGDTTGLIQVLDSTNFGVLLSRDLGDGAITAITVNAPEPATIALLVLAAAAAPLRRRVA
ncbi:MAG: PEP-CTERM sorting domain-containing protein [Planctomycetota bacterium]